MHGIKQINRHKTTEKRRGEAQSHETGKCCHFQFGHLIDPSTGRYSNVKSRHLTSRRGNARSLVRFGWPLVTSSQRQLLTSDKQRADNNWRPSADRPTSLVSVSRFLLDNEPFSPAAHNPLITGSAPPTSPPAALLHLLDPTDWSGGQHETDGPPIVRLSTGSGC